VRNLKQRKRLIPPWNMPSDPVKAVFWFVDWLLRVLLGFFWILILVGVAYESYLNGFVGGIVTLLVGLGLWLGLGITLFVFNISTNISRTISEVNRMQQNIPLRRSFSPSSEEEFDKSRIVEGTVTDLEEERRKRRRE
jgi:hypothetical protein